MRRITAILIRLLLSASRSRQGVSGIVGTRFIHSAYLESSGAENPDPRISIYFTQDYDE